jgi:hypothetical protein
MVIVSVAKYDNGGISRGMGLLITHTKKHETAFSPY